MSKKLLMTATDEFRGPIVYETISGTDIQAKPSNNNYSILEDEPLYFEGCSGSIQFNGSNMPTFLGNEVEPGIYEYYILQKSVINPERTAITSFRINQQLVSWTNTWRDRLYWDDEEGCYMIEKNANFVRVDGTDPSAFKSIDSSFTTIEVDGYPNSMDDYKVPYVTSNWTVASRRNCIDNGWRAIIGYAWTANELVCFMNFGSVQSTETILSVFVNNPLNATFPTHNQASNGSLDTSGAIPVEGVRLERTSLKKKIKLKQYKGGTIYSMVSAEQALKSSVSINIPTMETKYLPKSESFSGVTIKPTIQDLNFIMEGDYVYFKGFSGTHGVTMLSGSGTHDQFKGISLLGEYVKENTYRYTINAKSADGTKSKNVTFDMAYQITGVGSDQTTNPVSKMYWSDEAGCYVADLYDKYLRIYSIPETYETWTYNGYTYFGFDTVNGAISYNTGAATNCNVTTNWYNASLQYQQGIRAVGYKNYESSYIGIAVKNKPDRESLNDYLLTSGYGPAEIIYRLSGIETVNAGINRKIKLPWFGEGTIYTMVKTTEYGVTLSPTIEIEVPLKYDFKIAYKIFDGRDIKLKNMEGRIIRNELPAYLEEVRGNSELTTYEEYVNNQYIRKETIRLLGTQTPRGWYSYNIYKTNASGKTETINFELPEMLCWYPGPNSSRPTAEVSFECPSQDDILYWDAPNKCYQIKRRTGYYFANSAYSDIEFLPYVYDGENIGPGAWEFYTEGIPNEQFSSNSYANINTNYISRAFNNAYSDFAHSWGAVFPVVYNSNSTGAYPSTSYPYNIFGIYTTAITLDELNVFLANRPFHLITAAYYKNRSRNNPYPIRNTNITKPVKIDISNDDVSKGVNLKVINGDIDARFKIAVPVTYTEIDVPTPTYDLGAPKDFNGSNVYVNTNIQLFNQAKDFTILLDYQHKTSDSTYVASDRTILHCRYENTGTSYRQCGLAVETTTAPEARIRCATDYSGEVLASPYTLNMYQSKNPDSNLNVLLYRYRTVIVYKAGLPYKVIQAGDGDIIQEYELYRNVPPFRAHTRPLYLGCQNSTSNSRSRYFAGRINECKVWDGVALTDGQILKILGDGPYPKESFTVSNKKFTGNQTSQVAGNQLDTGVTIFDYGFTDVDFTIFLEFDKGTGGSSTPRVLCCSDTTSGYEFLSVHSEDSRKTFNIRAYNSGDSKYYELLKNPLPSVNDHYKFFICYRAGMVDSVIDYSTGVPVRLELADTLPTAPPGLSLTYYNVLLGAAPFSSLTNTRYVWGGTIKHCKIWKGKLLSSYDMDYVVNNVLK